MPVKNTNKAVKSNPEKTPIVRNCSFCGKSSEVSRRLIAGPNNIFICDDCVSVCVHILSEELGLFACPFFYKKTSGSLEDLGSQLSIAPNKYTRKKYDVLYLSPQNKLSEKIYTNHVLPLAEKYKIKIRHLSEILESQISFDKELLDNALLVIADVHGKDPDIMYFLGMVHLIGKPLIILMQTSADIPRGFFSERYYFYDNNSKSLAEIAEKIQPIFQSIKKIKKLTQSKHIGGLNGKKKLNKAKK